MSEANEVDGVYMRREWFNKKSDCTVKGFFKDGEYHIQSVEYRGT